MRVIYSCSETFVNRTGALDFDYSIYKLRIDSVCSCNLLNILIYVRYNMLLTIVYYSVVVLHVKYNAY